MFVFFLARQLGAFSLRSDSTNSLQTHSELCHNFLNLTPIQRRKCARDPRILEAISQGSKMGKEECQHQFRHSRWNCTAGIESESLYGEVIVISMINKIILLFKFSLTVFF